MSHPLPRSPLPHDPLVRTVRRHRYFLGAVGVHVAVLTLLSQLAERDLEQATLQHHQVQIQAHTQAAETRGMRRRVDSLKAMKALVDRIERARSESAEAAEPGAAASAADGEATAASGAAGARHLAAAEPAAQTPQQVLAQARELRDSIRRVEQAAQAHKLAELLKLSPEAALQQVQQQAAEAARGEAAADAQAAASPEQVMQALSRYEQQARESLQRLQALRTHERQGMPVHAGAADGGAAHTGDVAAAGGGAGGSAGPGNPGAPGDARSAATARGSGGGAEGAGGAGQADGRVSSVQDTQPRRYDGWQQHTPAVEARQLRLGAGNSLGAGGVWANRVFVDRWYVIGPFHATGDGSINKLYPPEQWVDLDGVYRGKGQRVLRWQYVSSASYPLIPPDPAERAIYYGYTEIVSDRPRTVTLALGADDDAKLWLNDQLRWTSGNQRKAWYTDGGVQSLKQDIRDRNLIEDRVRVPLRQGRNTVLFKLYNNPLDVFFSLVIEPVADGG